MAYPEKTSARQAPMPAATAPYGPKIQAAHKMNISPTLMLPMDGAGTDTNVVTTQITALKIAHVVNLTVFFIWKVLLNEIVWRNNTTRKMICQYTLNKIYVVLKDIKEILNLKKIKDR